MSNPFEEIEIILSKNLPLENDIKDEIHIVFESREFNDAMNRVVLGAIAGMMGKLGSNAQALYKKSVGQMTPLPHEVLAITIPLETAISDQIMNSAPVKADKNFFFTADFLQNFSGYMRFLHTYKD